MLLCVHQLFCFARLGPAGWLSHLLVEMEMSVNYAELMNQQQSGQSIPGQRMIAGSLDEVVYRKPKYREMSVVVEEWGSGEGCSSTGASVLFEHLLCSAAL